MSATEVIKEIEHLPPAEQAEVIQFAYRLDADRMLNGKELGELARRMVEATVVAPSSPRAMTKGRSRTDTLRMLRPSRPR